MESMRRGEANTSHHQNKVALNSLGTDSNKQTNNSCNNNINNNNKQSASIQSTEIKETNFEYDDNEWDVGGIGDLLIDLDADIAKSTGTSQSSISSSTATTGSLSTTNSSSNTINNTPNTNQSVGGGFSSKINTTSSSSGTPLRQSQFSSSKSSAFTATNIIKSTAGSGGVSSSNSASGLHKIQPQLLIQTKQQLQQTGPNTIANNTKQIVPSALLAQLNSNNLLLNVSDNIISLGNTSNKLSQNLTSDPDRVNTLQIQTTMSSTPGGGGTGKATTKMSMDHQATLDKGLKMKIKRTKPGTKTSEAKHEIVKAEQNGTSSNLDDSNNSSSNSGSKKHSQISAPPVVPAPTTPQATKRGNSSHRRDKTRDKTPHSQREKGDHNNSSSSQTNSDRCNCSLDLQVNGIQTPCSSLTCIRIRTTDTNNSSLGQRIIGSNNSNSNSSSISNSNSISSNNSSSGIFSTNSNSNSTQITGGGTPNAPGPPKESTGKISSTSASQQISNLTQSQQQSLNQSSSTSIKSQNCTNSTSISSASSLTSNSSSNSSSSNSSSIDEKCSSSPPPAKKIKCDSKDMVDMCVGTSVGTITEPDCLGPCEPGTSVTLEGIVWHETEGGVLVVNVTWRGKTYVGTLLDCTRHDWAPPRFCDSPTEELDSRTPKGRGKRGRSATILPSNDLSNFTETRSSVHSKLRNGGAKGRGGRTSTTTGTTTSTTTTTSTVTSANTVTNSSSNSSNTPSSSPTAFLPPRPEKRKSKDESPSPVNGDSATQSVVNPVTGLNVQISTKKCKTASPCAVSPVLLECPEQDCSKKYKHANGLRYHQSHAHGSGSMDEDSMQPPESPQRIVPSTTPSPVPPSTPQNPIQQTNSGQPSTPTSSQPTTVAIASESISTTPCTVISTNTTTTPPTIPPLNTSNTNSTPTTSVNTTGPTLLPQQTVPVPPQQILPQPSLNSLQQQPPPQLQSGTIQTPISSSVSTGSLLGTINNNSSSQNSQPPPQQLQQPLPLPVNQLPQNLSQPSPASGAGGSITAGISGQMVQQHIMAATNPLLVNASSSILGQTIPEATLSVINPQQPQPQMSMNNGITSTPTRSDPQSKLKPGVLRFGPPPTENDRLQVASINTQSGPTIPSNPGPIRPSPVNALTGNAVPHQNSGTPDGVPNYNALQQSQQNLSQSSPVAAFKVKSTASLMPSQVGGTIVNSAVNKPQNYGKTKKSRKSPGPGDYENAAAQRAEDVQSPAYSDISDDSTPVTETEIGDKSQSIKHNDITKKPPETTPGQLGGVGSYGMYPFYAQSPYIVPSDHQQNKPSVVSQSQLSQQTPGDYSNKNKDPPLDLMNKQGNQTSELNSQSKDSGPSTQSSKILPHFYSSYNYINPGGYPPYNIDPNYGAVSMITDENKMNSSSQTNSMGGGVKEERNKENPSPSEHVKMNSQMMSSKLIKSEPQLSKDLKLESMHGKDTLPQPLCGYPGMYQRHGLGVAPPPQHISRDDDIRRYYIYPEQRRSSTSSNSSSTNLQGGLKDEPPSPSQTLPPQNLNQQTSQSVSSQQSSKQSKSSSLNSSGQNVSQQQSQKASNMMKDQKPDDKEMLKVKQEGQKPTMETQGPPPPPTSQYYLHHSYMSPASFGFDPAHQMYRNMLVPAAPYNPTPYHLQMPRYHPPEDLSRNPNTKALDLLQHHASQYYNTHKIHELSERALKSPTSNVKVAVSSPNVSQQSNTNSNVGMQQQNTAGGGLSLQPPSSAVPPSGGGPVVGGVPLNASKPCSDKTSTEPTKDGQNNGRSPPPQRHVHTHHHTHVGLTYPMYPAPYQAAVLASQQAAAVAVINPFPPASQTK